MPVLTDAAVRKYVAQKQRREIADARARGLHLVIQPTGRKSWALRFRRPDGKPAKLTLGPLDLGNEPADEAVIGGPLTLAMARELAAKIDRQRKQGLDVVAEHKAQQERSRAPAEAAGFGAAVADFAANYRTSRHTPLRRLRDTARVWALP